MDKQLEGIYPSIESVLEKVQQLLGKNLAIDQQTLVTNKDKQDNRAMAELNYVLLFGQTTNSDYWYPKKRLGQSITDLEGNKEFNHQADFINSGSANSDISSPRFNGTYTNQPWLEPNSDRNATK